MGLIALLLGLAALWFGALDTPRQAEAAAVIGAGSCLDMDDCTNLAAGTVIGADSCNSGGLKDACDDLNGTVGDGSCLGAFACLKAGEGGLASIGSNSCNAEGACQEYGGAFGDGTIGNNSCNALAACLEAGNSFGLASIGSNSCNAEGACSGIGVFGDGTVGNNSCNAGEACQSNGRLGVGTVGDNSCNAGEACFANGKDGEGSVGSYSCTTLKDDCFENQSVIGSCMFNDVDPDPCFVPDPDPAAFPQFNGTPVPLATPTAVPTQAPPEPADATPADQVGAISPPSTGSGGLRQDKTGMSGAADHSPL